MTNKIKPTSNKSKSIIIVTALFAVVGAIMLIFANAATPTQTGTVTTLATGGTALSLTPASGSYDVSTNFTLGIYENSSTAEVSTADVKLSYDATKLDFVSVDGSGGAFSNCIENTGGSGTVSLVCSKLGGSVTGSQKIGNVTFKAKVGSGSTAVNFAASSHVWSYASTPVELWNGVTTGGTYTLKTPSTGGTGGGGTGGSGGTPTTPAPTSSTSTPKPTTTTSGGSKSTTTSTSSNSNPAATSANPTIDTTYQGSTSGLVAIKVTDAQGKPLAGVSVTLGSFSAVSDSSGIASFSGIAQGKYTVAVKTDKGETKSKIDVKAATNAGEVQQFTLQVKPKSMIVYYAIIGAGILAVLAIAGVFLKKWQQKSKFNRSHGLSNSAVVFDASSSVHNPQTNSIDQGPIVTPTPASPPVPPIAQTKGPEGSIITPNSSSAPKTT